MKGSHALVVFTDIHYAVVYSLPHLELIHTLSLPAVTSMCVLIILTIVVYITIPKGFNYGRIW